MDKKRSGIIILIQAILGIFGFRKAKTKAGKAVAVATVLTGGEVAGYFWTRKRLQKLCLDNGWTLDHYNVLDHLKYASGDADHVTNNCIVVPET